MWMLLLLGRRNVEAVRELKVSSKLDPLSVVFAVDSTMSGARFIRWQAFYDHDATMIRWANHHVYSAFQ